MIPVIIIGVAIALAIIATVTGSDKPLGLDLETMMPVLGAVLMALVIGAGAGGQ
jgi:peptidoglycan/LPS O-acetylase OafA/YrhL